MRQTSLANANLSTTTSRVSEVSLCHCCRNLGLICKLQMQDFVVSRSPDLSDAQRQMSESHVASEEDNTHPVGETPSILPVT